MTGESLNVAFLMIGQQQFSATCIHLAQHWHFDSIRGSSFSNVLGLWWKSTRRMFPALSIIRNAAQFKDSARIFGLQANCMGRDDP